MNMHTDPRFATMGRRVVDEATDQGLRAYMLKVYNYMTAGLAVTGLLAWIFGNTPLMTLLYNVDGQGYVTGMSGLGIAVALAPLAYMFLINGIITKSLKTSHMIFWSFCVVMGMSMSSIFLVYTTASIYKVLFITASGFAGLSIYGYTTKRNLTALGSFLGMAVWGLLLAMVINIFVASSTADLMISVAAVLVFAGLTAYDTQKIKSMYFHVSGDQVYAEKTAIMGALTLYLDFIIMFQHLLNLLGNRE